MSLKVGDSVLFLKDNDYGVILEIIGRDKAVVKNSNDFSVHVPLKDLILASSDTLETYGDNFVNKDDLSDQKKFSPKSANRDISKNKIDLHVENLLEDFKSLSHAEIVRIQLGYCEKAINSALTSSVEELMIIHGIGSGVLKQEVHILLDNYKLRYYLSKDGGATIVFV